MKKIVAIILCVLNGLNLQAEPTTPNKPPPIATYINDGISPPYLQFKDGRKAGLFQERGKIIPLPFKLLQTENTCDDSATMATCVLLIGSATSTISVRWIDNPDSTKIGQVIKYSSSTEQVVKNSLDQTVINLRWGNSGPYNKEFNKDSIQCSNFDWLKNIKRDSNNLVISSWISEFNSTNTETNLSENQGLFEAHSLQFKSIDTNKYEIYDYKKSNSDTSPFFSSQTAKIEYETEDQRHCQVSFTVDASEAVKVFNSTEYRTLLPETRTRNKEFKSYIYEIMNMIVNNNGSTVEVE